MSKSTNTVVYFDWKTIIYIYACEKKSHTIYAVKFEQTIIHQHVHLRRKNQSHVRVHVLMRLYTQSINYSFVYKAKEGRHVRIFDLTRSGLEPTIYCTRGEHTNYYTTDVVMCKYTEHTDKIAVWRAWGLFFSLLDNSFDLQDREDIWKNFNYFIGLKKVL